MTYSVNAHNVTLLPHTCKENLIYNFVDQEPSTKIMNFLLSEKGILNPGQCQNSHKVFMHLMFKKISLLLLILNKNWLHFKKENRLSIKILNFKPANVGI